MPPLTHETVAALVCALCVAISLIVIALAYILDARWTVEEHASDHI